MNLLSKKKIVVLGMMTRMPVAGVVWQTVQYLVGFERLGYEVYYVEAHGCTPSALMKTEEDDGSRMAAAFIDRVLRPFDLAGRWAYHAVHADGGYYGMTEAELKGLYDSAALIINLHGGTVPLPEHYATGRLVYLETDPVELQIELYDNLQRTLDFLSPHCAFFTFGENYGKVDCKLPVCARFPFLPTRQPVVLDFWQGQAQGPGERFTTIANWRQPHREIRFNGEVYHWSKHYEFLKFLDLPRRSRQAFELALSSCGSSDQKLLQDHGWQVSAAADVSEDMDVYRTFIAQSRGEYTVAKDQNIRLCTGWFSDRSATYLAAGRPVVTQETGFSNILPTGAGLFGFSTLDEVVAAMETINADYERHSRAAADVARDYFSSDVVLSDLLSHVGL